MNFCKQEQLTITATNNSSTKQTFNLSGTMTGLPLVDDSQLIVNQNPLALSGDLLTGEPYVSSGYSGAVEYAYIVNRALNQIEVVNIETNTLFTTIATGANPVNIKRVGSYLYVSGGSGINGFVNVIDPNLNTVITTIITAGVGAITVCGSRIVVGNYSTNPSKDITIIDCNTNTLLSVVSSSDLSYYGCFNPSTNKCYLFSLISDLLIEIDVLTYAKTTIATPFSIPSSSSGVYITYVSEINSVMLTQGTQGNNIGLYNTNTSTWSIVDTSMWGKPQHILNVNGYCYIGVFEGYILKFSNVLGFIVDSIDGIFPSTTKLFPNYVPNNNTLMFPCYTSGVVIVTLDDFKLSNSLSIFNTYSVVKSNLTDTFLTVNRTSGIVQVKMTNPLSIVIGGGVTPSELSEQVTYEPIEINKMVIDNLQDKSSLSNIMYYGSKNPSGDDKSYKYSLLQYFSADSNANLVEYGGGKVMVDGYHYLSFTVDAGQTLAVSFWFNRLSSNGCYPDYMQNMVAKSIEKETINDIYKLPIFELDKKEVKLLIRRRVK